jgi:DNA-binding XRE family transcriptional regulator
MTSAHAKFLAKDATRFGYQPCLQYINPSEGGSFPVHPGRAGRIREMARIIGVTDHALSNYTHGRRNAPWSAKQAVADVLGLPIEACWTAEYLAAPYRGMRGGGNRKQS